MLVDVCYHTAHGRQRLRPQYPDPTPRPNSSLFRSVKYTILLSLHTKCIKTNSFLAVDLTLRTIVGSLRPDGSSGKMRKVLTSRGDWTADMTRRRTPRVPKITSRKQILADQRDRFDRIERSRGSDRGPFRVLLHSLEIAERVGHLGEYVRYESKLPDPVREVAILTTARAYGCTYEYAAHDPIAREVGVEEVLIHAISHDGPLEGLAEIDVDVVRFGRRRPGAPIVDPSGDLLDHPGPVMFSTSVRSASDRTRSSTSKIRPMDFDRSRKIYKKNII